MKKLLALLFLVVSVYGTQAQDSTIANGHFYKHRNGHPENLDSILMDSICNRGTEPGYYVLWGQKKIKHKALSMQLALPLLEEQVCLEEAVPLPS